MLYTINTKSSIESVKKDIAMRVEEQGFGILKEYHFKEILQSKGYPIEKDITVFEICNPSAAHTILDKYPEVSVFLPCRISLYEEDGKTTLSTIRIDGILKNFELDSEMKTYMQTIFHKVQAIINTWI
ncbi:MAG: DUF302 domain-containing protein [Sulfurospirillaceae bacterium]|nr:DUF302 domain-containing protein [Sulfurospirillaceae bacterium]